LINATKNYHQATINNIRLIIKKKINHAHHYNEQRSTTTNNKRWIDGQYNQQQTTDKQPHQIDHR
jgi:hypothetical protein